MKKRSVHVSSLVLDKENPRHESISESIEQSIERLLGGSPEQLLNLARDIAKNGLNPVESILVTQEGGQCVVIEGNRRVASIKLLLKPSLAPSAELRKRFADASTGFEVPRRIEVVEALHRDAAEHWIRLRHTGQNQGVGVVKWSPAEVGRFAARTKPSASNYTENARLLIDAVREWYPNDEEIARNAQSIRDRRITNLGRMLADPAFRQHLGLSFDGRWLYHHYSPGRLHPALKRIFSDLAEFSVDKIKLKDQREAYMLSVAEDLPHVSERMASRGVYGQTRSSEPNEDLPSRETVKTRPDLPVQTRRVRAASESTPFSGVELRNVSLRTKDLLVEVKKVKIDEMPNVAAVMIRAVVDVVVSEVGRQRNWARNQDTLKGRVHSVLNQVDRSKVDPELSEAWRLSQDDGALSLKSLHAFVHSSQGNPLTSDIRKLSAAYAPLLMKADALLAGERS